MCGAVLAQVGLSSANSGQRWEGDLWWEENNGAEEKKVKDGWMMDGLWVDDG